MPQSTGSPASGNTSRPSLWTRLWSKPRSRWMFGIPVGAVLFFIGGILFWGGFNTALEVTNTEQFCLSCHEMRTFLYPEYQETIHFSNRTGARASCPDCHVPRPWGHKVVRKIQASNELWHKAMGTIATREKFEAHRLKLAQKVWADMKATDSRECRNCHDFESMSYEKQDRFAARRHEKGFKKGETCIDCHKGVAHHLPEGYVED